MKNLYYIAIEGVIGVGKTSLAKLLADSLSAKLILEKFENNPFLEEFYREPERYAFQTQLFFLLERYKQQQELKQVDIFHKLLISDYMFEKDKLFANLNLGEKELGLYEKIETLLEKQVPSPDLVIYLQSDINNLMDNISNRARPYEENISVEYLQSLRKIYNEFFFHYEKCPVLIINTNEIDFVKNEEDLEKLIKIVRQPISGTVYYNP
ncbi:MAG TPA: deoxynucleoside kinase [bacterium]|nr:deoxynucleoside kinase [Candidatus Neomarinimicrobiota bacterium]HMA61609.1 deoxynucleoside kinase [bacterium]